MPGRSNIVLSTVSGFAPSADVIVTRDLPTALGLAREIATRDGVGECMVIGGAEIYRQCLRFADRIYLTQIELEIAGDTWFPEIDPRQWRESERVPGQSAAEPGLRFCFVTLERLPAVAGRAI